MIFFIILANSKNDKLRNMTQDCINSICGSDEPPFGTGLSKRYIATVECCPGVKYPQAEMLEYKDPPGVTGFNYNHALNTGVERFKHIFNMNPNDDGDSWFCFMNNDVVCSKDWLIELDKAVREHPEIDSMCPNIRERGEGVRFGYATWVHLDGCCVFCRASALKNIWPFDERFKFFFQDDDYCEQLQRHGIVHGKVMSSMIRHLGSQTLPEDAAARPLLFQCRDEFIGKYGMDTYLRREREKRQKI